MLHKFLSTTLPASLVSLVLSARPGLAALSEDAQCLHARSSDLSIASVCGHSGSLNYCFTVAPEDVNIDYLRKCFVNAGCEFEEAVVEADWTLRMCNDQSAVELRRRLFREEAGLDDVMALVPRATSSTSAETTSTEATTSTSDSSTTASDSSSTTASSTASSDTTTTTSDSTTSSNASSTSGSSASSTTAASSTSSTTSLVCSTTTYISTTVCPTQSTGTASGQTLSCYSTAEATETCAAGLMCITDSDTGSEGCIVPEGMGTWGVIVMVYFGVVVGVALIAVCTASCREKRATKKLRAEWEAAAAAQAAASAAKTQRRRSQMTMSSRRNSGAGLLNNPAQ